MSPQFRVAVLPQRLLVLASLALLPACFADGTPEPRKMYFDHQPHSVKTSKFKERQETEEDESENEADEEEGHLTSNGHATSVTPSRTSSKTSSTQPSTGSSHYNSLATSTITFPSNGHFYPPAKASQAEPITTRMLPSPIWPALDSQPSTSGTSKSQAHNKILEGLGKGGIIGASLGAFVILSLILMLVATYFKRKRRARKQPRRSTTITTFFRTRSKTGRRGMQQPILGSFNNRNRSNSYPDIPPLRDMPRGGVTDPADLSDSSLPSPLYPPPGLGNDHHSYTPSFYAPYLDRLGPEHDLVKEEVREQQADSKSPNIVVTNENERESNRAHSSASRYDPPPYKVAQ